MPIDADDLDIAELEIFEIETTEANTIPPRLAGMPEVSASKLIFEAERYTRKGGVRNCGSHKDRLVQAAIARRPFRASPSTQTG